MTFELYCPHCKKVHEVQAKVGTLPTGPCPTCQEPLVRYFGQSSTPFANFGERIGMDNIQRYQFQNLG